MELRPKEINAFEGKEITLRCQNKGSEKFGWTDCRWTREKDGTICFFKAQKITGDPSSLEVFQVCNGSLHSRKIEFFGFDSPRTICGIKFKSLLKEDESRWSCNMDYHDIPNVGYCTAKRRIFTRVSIELLV